LENGPFDDLMALDAYKGLSDLASEGTGASGQNRRNNPMGKGGLQNAMNSSRGSGSDPQSLWEAILCGPDERARRDPMAGRRADFSAMWLRSTGCTAEDIAQLITVEDGKLVLDEDEINQRIRDTIGPGINNLDDAARGAVLAAVAQSLGQDPEAIAATIGGATSLLDPANYEDAKSFTEMLKGITGNSDIAALLDMETEFAVLDTLINKAVELGIPQAVDHILDEFENDALRKRALVRNIRRAAMNSQLGVVQQGLDELGRHRVMQRVPDLHAMVLKYYRFPQGTTSQDYDTHRTELFNLLDGADPNWAVRDRNGVTVSDLRPFQSVSNDAQKLLQHTQYQVPMQLGREYPQEPIKDVARQTRPYVAI
jgi:hypothetical protein